MNSESTGIFAVFPRAGKPSSDRAQHTIRLDSSNRFWLETQAQSFRIPGYSKRVTAGAAGGLVRCGDAASRGSRQKAHSRRFHCGGNPRLNHAIAQRAIPSGDES
jgi:hypothetical protein